MLTDIIHRIKANPSTYSKYWLEQLQKIENNEIRLKSFCEQISRHLDFLINRCNLITKTKISYPEELPVSQEIASIKEFAIKNQLIIVCGETGSGKTTQLPKMLLELGYAQTGLIGHTQPRRIAARSLANRISHELGSTEITTRQSELVGYKMRFQDKTNPNTAIKLMTDGILLQEIQNDRLLLQYSALIIDEVHERSLNIDFILGYLKQILPKRPDLKVIITSATLENEKLAKFFNNAPIVNVTGKTYPVDIVYQDINDNEDENNLNLAIYKAIKAALEIEPGNVLIFLPGEREIKLCLNLLRKTELNNYELLPLFARQNSEAQSLIFNSNGKIKIILATNIAETSLTIPGIKFVIDSGIARVKRYTIRNRIEQLQIEPISQASAKQRAGRAGRVSHGMCIRLFSESDFNLRRQFTEPELLRSNLANVILRLMTLNLGDPRQFEFLDPPDAKTFNDGLRTLFQIGAIDESNQITALGRKLAQIPVDVQLARVLVAAGEKFKVLSEALIIVAFLAIQDPREFPIEHQQLVKERHSLWVDKDSEFIQILNLWNWYHNELHHKKSNKKLLEICHKQFLSLARMREWHEMHRELRETTLRFGFKENTIPADYQNLHSAILSGFITNVGQKDIVENYYLSTNDRKYWPHPSLLITPAKWMVAASIVETSRVYARNCAKIEPNWLSGIADHLYKYTYSNQHWDKKRGEVIANESVLLYGLLIITRKISYSKIDPTLSQEIMIKEALINNQLLKTYPFVIHNLQVVNELNQIEDKLRTSLALIEEELYNFYVSRLDSSVMDQLTLEQFLNSNSEALKIDRDEFINRLTSSYEELNLYPDDLLVNGQTIKLKYIFDHESNEDGLIALINLDKLNLIDSSDAFIWLVPGLIREKIAYLIRSLPKNQRILFNPIQESISEFLQSTRIRNNFFNEFIHYAKTHKNLVLHYPDLLTIKFPTQLNCHFRIMDKKQLLESGDDLEIIKKKVMPLLSKIVVNNSTNQQINNLSGFIPEIQSLLEPVELKDGNRNLIAYKSLIHDKNGQINYIVVGNLDEAERSSRVGLLHLIKVQLKEQQKYLSNKKIANFTKISMALSDLYHKDELSDSCTNYILNHVILNLIGTKLNPNKEEFDQIITMVKATLGSFSVEFENCLSKVADLYHEIKLKINEHPLFDIIQLQLDDLIYPKFLSHTKWKFLQNFSRYLQAIVIRLNKYPNAIMRDQQLDYEINTIYNTWYNHVETLEENQISISSSLYDFKYSIEELRISLFAQEIRTLYPVSSKRLNSELEKLYISNLS